MKKIIGLLSIALMLFTTTSFAQAAATRRLIWLPLHKGGCLGSAAALGWTVGSNDMPQELSFGAILDTVITLAPVRSRPDSGVLPARRPFT